MLAVVLACFAVGVALRHTIPTAVGLLPQLDRFVLWVALPALILAKLPQAELGESAVPAAVAWGSMAVAVVAVLLAARLRGWSRSTTGTLLLVSALGNTSFLGLGAVEDQLHGRAEVHAQPQRPGCRQVQVHRLLRAVGPVEAGALRAGGEAPRRLLTFPAFLAMLLTVPLRTWPLPAGLTDVLSGVGRLVAPVAMLALGLRFRLRLASHVRQAAAWCLATKMVVLPGLVLLVSVVAGTTDEIPWRTSVLEAGMPPMVTAGVVAVQAGLDEELSTFVVGAGLVLAAVTLPLLRLALG